MVLRFALVFALVAAGAAAQQKFGFVIDETKPYVYIKFDHVGKRKALSEDEVPKGLWLRLVNNCRVPISVSIFNPGTGDPGIGVYDEIIAVSAAGFSYVDSSGVFHGDESPPEKPPKAYSRAEVSSFTVISPGDTLLFSVPFNHVSQHWYLQVEFALEPTKKGFGGQPRSFADFTWSEIPKQFREAGHP